MSIQKLINQTKKFSLLAYQFGFGLSSRQFYQIQFNISLHADKTDKIKTINSNQLTLAI